MSIARWGETGDSVLLKKHFIEVLEIERRRAVFPGIWVELIVH